MESYRKYLVDSNIPIPRTTEWRQAKSELSTCVCVALYCGVLRYTRNSTDYSTFYMYCIHNHKGCLFYPCVLCIGMKLMEVNDTCSTIGEFHNHMHTLGIHT